MVDGTAVEVSSLSSNLESCFASLRFASRTTRLTVVAETLQKSTASYVPPPESSGYISLADYPLHPPFPMLLRHQGRVKVDCASPSEPFRVHLSFAESHIYVFPYRILYIFQRKVDVRTRA